MNIFRFLFSRIFLINLFIAVILLLAIGWMALTFLENYTMHGESITVPDFKGLSLKQTEQLLKNKQLQYKIMDSTYVAGQLPLIVLEQSPKPLSKVKQNRTVYLTVNATHPPTVKMPDLKDVSLKQAVLILESYGLKAGELIYKPDLAQNAVLEQQVNGVPVQAGYNIPKGTTVDLILGNGLGNTLVEVPNLIGLTMSEAKFVLQGSSLNFGAIIFDGQLQDTSAALVIKQIPAHTEQAKLNMGEAIDIFLRQKNSIDSLQKK